MRREDLTELHNIAPLSNLESILRHGILSHSRAAGVEHASVAMNEIQDRREGVAVPGGKRLHDYANLYICARNPMMYKLKNRHRELCVLQVSTDVLDLPEAIVTDRNAASSHAIFAAAPGGLRIVNAAATFAESWTDADLYEYWRKKLLKCAEVLVRDSVPPEYIMGIYASCDETAVLLEGMVRDLEITVWPHLFFR